MVGFLALGKTGMFTPNDWVSFLVVKASERIRTGKKFIRRSYLSNHERTADSLIISYCYYGHSSAFLINAPYNLTRLTDLSNNYMHPFGTAFYFKYNYVA